MSYFYRLDRSTSGNIRSNGSLTAMCESHLIERNNETIDSVSGTSRSCYRLYCSLEEFENLEPDHGDKSGDDTGNNFFLAGNAKPEEISQG